MYLNLETNPAHFKSYVLYLEKVKRVAQMYDEFHIMSEQENIIQPGKERAWSKVEFCKNLFVVQMVGTVFLFAVSSLTRTREPYLMQVIKYSVLIVTFFAEV